MTAASRRRGPALAAVWASIGLLLAATLTPLGGAAGVLVAWRCVACTADGGADFAANVAAFVPLGLALVAAGVRAPRAALAGTALSAAIELLQALGVPGRTAILGDVLANGAGTVIGAATAAASGLLLRPAPRAAAALAAGAAVLWTWTMTASAWLLGRDATAGPRPPRADVLATVPNHGWYHGRVARFTLDGWGASRSDAGPLILVAPLGDRARGHAALVGGDARSSFVPAVAVFDAELRPALLLGQRGTAAELRPVTRARRWRLREPALVVPHALAEQAEGSAVRTDVTFTLDGGAATLSVARATPAGPAVRAGTLRPGPALGWTLVVPGARPWGAERPLLDALWVGALLVPVGYWAGTATRGARRGAGAAVVAGVAVVAGGLAAGPVLAGAVPGTPADAAVAVGALLAGARAARLPALRAPASLRG